MLLKLFCGLRQGQWTVHPVSLEYGVVMQCAQLLKIRLSISMDTK